MIRNELDSSRTLRGPILEFCQLLEAGIASVPWDLRDQRLGGLVEVSVKPPPVGTKVWQQESVR